MANIKCGGDPAVIYGDNSMDRRGTDTVAYMTGVVVNITTTNDDGSTTYQILSINNETLKQVGNIFMCVYACVRACMRVCACVYVCVCVCVCVFVFSYKQES